MRHLMTLALSTLLLAWSTAFAVEVESVQPGEGTIGTTITVTGEGFGTKKPKLVLTQVVNGKTVKITPKITAFSDTEITALIKSAKIAGSYDATVTVKGQSPAVLEDAFELMGPEVDEVDPDEGSPEQEVTILGNFFDAKPKVIIGGQKAKVLNSIEDEITVLVPKKLANGFYDVTVTTKVGTATLPTGFKVKGSLIGVPKKKLLTWKVNGKSYSIKDSVALQGVWSPITKIMIVNGVIPGGGLGSTLRTLTLAIFIDLEADMPQLLSHLNANESLITYSETRLVLPPDFDPGTMWTTSDSNNWQISINSYSEPRVSGTFSGTLTDPNEEEPNIQITEGQFSLDLYVD